MKKYFIYLWQFIISKFKKPLLKMETIVINLIAAWLKSNTDKSKAKQVIETILKWLQTVAANLDNIIAGTLILPVMEGEIPTWATILVEFITEAIKIVPNIATIKAVIDPILNTLTAALTQLTTDLANGTQAQPPAAAPAAAPVEKTPAQVLADNAAANAAADAAKAKAAAIALTPAQLITEAQSEIKEMVIAAGNIKNLPGAQVNCTAIQVMGAKALAAIEALSAQIAAK